MEMEFKKIIQAKLIKLEPRRLAGGYQREAAVLMPIFELDGEPHFLLTQRTEEVRTHKGQISFPGGMRQGDERLEETALRETFEEIGLARDKIEVLGQYHDYLSITQYRVVPFAGFVEQPFTTTPQAEEVAEVLQVPFRIFADPRRLRVEQMFRLGKNMDIYFYYYGANEIWGLTAKMIKDFLEELGLTDNQ